MTLSLPARVARNRHLVHGTVSDLAAVIGAFKNCDRCSRTNDFEVRRRAEQDCIIRMTGRIAARMPALITALRTARMTTLMTTHLTAFMTCSSPPPTSS